jgi:hypothetical protein
VVAKVRGKLAGGKQTAQKFDFGDNVKKLSGLEDMKQYQIKVKNRFATLEILYVREDIHGACEHIKENIKISARV